ncbi:hypothetical protein BLS_001596 [Venturia inaequalis]|uniref:Uncharacterized protein n=1 Tax=Venturia inaequalis TaxID=5025 RepID=A0A8H3YL39_VENIN|nr:hypothetical protein BLS_001596 [Venturia inaequalis]KAE9965432.1 hypothetical protein EG328_009662 [Venturia inaequalis]RDI77370.1 hypothetical protein Vi05172_g12668 [Venturia inaequalis]
MSPDRGYSTLPRSVKSEESIKTTMRKDSGYERPSLQSVSPSENPRYSGRSWTSQHSHSYRTHQIDTMTEEHCERNTSPSIKSFSSAPKSRRDSAISESSKEHRRRPRTARTPSKTSLKPGRDTSLSECGSSPIRQRPRRCATSPSANPPYTNIEEALALHERSRQILAMGTVSTPYQSTASVAPKAPIMYRSQTTVDYTYGCRQHDQLPRLCTTSIAPLAVEQEIERYVPIPATTTYWTTTESKRQEYAKIDKANKGIRGMWKKMIPKFARTTGDSKFFDEKDDSDVCSVRRYRLELDD